MISVRIIIIFTFPTLEQKIGTLKTNRNLSKELDFRFHRSCIHIYYLGQKIEILCPNNILFLEEFDFHYYRNWTSFLKEGTRDDP